MVSASQLSVSIIQKFDSRLLNLSLNEGNDYCNVMIPFLIFSGPVWITGKTVINVGIEAQAAQS